MPRLLTSCIADNDDDDDDDDDDDIVLTEYSLKQLLRQNEYF
jgi:hypothetical protein